MSVVLKKAPDTAPRKRHQAIQAINEKQGPGRNAGRLAAVSSPVQGYPSKCPTFAACVMPACFVWGGAKNSMFPNVKYYEVLSILLKRYEI